VNHSSGFSGWAFSGGFTNSVPLKMHFPVRLEGSEEAFRAFLIIFEKFVPFSKIFVLLLLIKKGTKIRIIA